MKNFDERDFLENCGYCAKKGENTISSVASGERLDVRALISALDAHFAREDLASAEELLSKSLKKAREIGDKTGELSILSELMGFHRRTANAEAALRACREGISLIGELGIEKSVSGATVLLNAATTMAAYGESREALPHFTEVVRVYSDTLDPSDYRFSGLYNNFGTALSAAGELLEAEHYYLRALALVEKNKNAMEIAVTHINLAELYHDMARVDSDELVERHVSMALSALDGETERGGYYAFTCRKCAPTLARLGYFFDAKMLNERADTIYEGN